ncbi:MAG: peroxiredoxin [Opitutales bacterium]|nr:peroxiredoxin [Opitutales bacterium]
MNRLFALFVMFIPSFLIANPIEVGEKAPTVTVTTHTGEQLDLAEAYAIGPVLIYFYPRAETPGCTRQACNIRDNFDAIESYGLTILGVSRDSVEKLAEFQSNHELPFTLIADEDRVLGGAFKVGSWMGMAYRRQTFLVVDGVVAWRDLSASPDSQSEDALAALRAMN